MATKIEESSGFVEGKGSKVVSDDDVPLRVLIGDPAIQGEGMKQHISYKVTTNTTLPQYKYGEFSVIRRYSDFVWLYEEMIKEFPGCIIPPLPEKQIVGRFQKDFVFSRQRGLQKFLNRIAQHPVLRQSISFQRFLEDTDFTKVKEDVKAKQGGRSIMQWFSDTAKTVSQKVSGGVEVPRTNSDMQIDEVSAYVDGLAPQLTNAHKHAASVVRREKELSSGLEELSLGFQLLAQAETDSLSNGLLSFSQTLETVAQHTARKAEAENVRFVEQLSDWMRMISSMKDALDRRSERKQMYAAALGDVQAKRTSLAKASSAKEGQARAALDQSIGCSEDAQKIHEATTEQVLAETERVKAEKLEEFRQMLLDFVQTQMEYHSQAEDAWRGILPELEALEVSSRAKLERTDGLGDDAPSAPMMAPPTAVPEVVQPPAKPAMVNASLAEQKDDDEDDLLAPPVPGDGGEGEFIADL